MLTRTAALPIGNAAASSRRLDTPSIRTVTTQDVVYHAADNGNTIARALIVAIAGAITVARATVIDRTTIDRSAAVAAPVSGNAAATGEVSPMSAARDASHCTSAHCVPYAGMSCADMSYTGVSCAAATGRVPGTRRIRRHWHTAEGDCCRKRDKCFMKQASLL